jgi:hypothetical protein
MTAVPEHATALTVGADLAPTIHTDINAFANQP